MSNFRQLVENILAKHKALTEEAVVYRTYMDKQWLNDITGNFLNKPIRGLWGCRDDSWKNWCSREDFPCSTNYFDWILKPGTKLYTIDSTEDFAYLLKKYPRINAADPNDVDIYIDFFKVAKDYDAVELTKKGLKELRFDAKTNDPEMQDPKYRRGLAMACYAWDVPSICVFYPKNTVQILN